MSYPPDFDPSTRCTERPFEEVWLPYAFPEDRVERDAIFGATPQVFELSVGIPAPRINEEYIPREKLFQVYDALQFANYFGYVFNVDLTISWQKSGIREPKLVDRAFQSLCERIRKYSEHRKLPVFYYAVFENGKYIGYHSHMRLHVPHAYQPEFARWLRGTLIRGFFGVSVEHFEARYNKDNHITGQWISFQYAFKGVD